MMSDPHKLHVYHLPAPQDSRDLCLISEQTHFTDLCGVKEPLLKLTRPTVTLQTEALKSLTKKLGAKPIGAHDISPVPLRGTAHTKLVKLL